MLRKKYPLEIPVTTGKGNSTSVTALLKLMALVGLKILRSCQGHDQGSMFIIEPVSHESSD